MQLKQNKFCKSVIVEQHTIKNLTVIRFDKFAEAEVERAINPDNAGERCFHSRCLEIKQVRLIASWMTWQTLIFYAIIGMESAKSPPGKQKYVPRNVCTSQSSIYNGHHFDDTHVADK